MGCDLTGRDTIQRTVQIPGAGGNGTQAVPYEMTNRVPVNRTRRLVTWRADDIRPYSGVRNYFEQALEICWATVQLGS